MDDRDQFCRYGEPRDGLVDFVVGRRHRQRHESRSVHGYFYALSNFNLIFRFIQGRVEQRVRVAQGACALAHEMLERACPFADKETRRDQRPSCSSTVKLSPKNALWGLRRDRRRIASSRLFDRALIGGGPVANRGLSWHAIGTGAGGSDILLQNTSGQASIWEMSGNTIAGGGPVNPSPGPTWHAITLT
jgi:hypothetical protein